MNFESYNKKILDLFNEPQKIDEKMQVLCSFTKPKETLTTLVPNEANFQLPNVFLRSKKIPECEKYITKNATEDEYKNNLTRVLDDFIFETDELVYEKKPSQCNDEILMHAIIKRF